MKLRAVIVDDEPLARNFLERYCEKHGNVEVKGSFPDVESALIYLQTNEVDILFLDVEMPGSNGFQLLDQLMYMPKVILTTSKREYAFDAFQYNVSDYLKKPITFARFQESINKISIAANTAGATPEKQDAAQDIFIKSDGKFTRLNYHDILYIESMGDYVKYFTASRSYVAHSTLKSVEEKIEDKHFMKVHRSYIVNLRKIKDIQDCTLQIEGKIIPISKVLKSEVMERLNVV